MRIRSVLDSELFLRQCTTEIDCSLIFFNRFSRLSVKEGFKAVKGNQLDAFVYDATVLEYLVGQDDECNVLTVGSWYAMTGTYHFALWEEILAFVNNW